MTRVFWIVCDSFGIGELPDANEYGDEGSNTLAAVRKSPFFHCPTMRKLGLFNIDGVDETGAEREPKGAFGRFAERSVGKDTTTGHWEMAGLISEKPFPTYPNGFPSEILQAFEKETGRGVLCNEPYSGTEVIKDYGKEHIKTGKWIVYTSADSVFQIAAHEKVVPVEELYDACEKARKILTGKHAVGRVIARPFDGEYPFFRTPRRHDFSLLPPKDTVLDLLKRKGLDVISVGKIYDIFAGKGITEKFLTTDNADGMEKTLSLAERDFHGVCFVNLVDFDMKYGHRNDVEGYAKALTAFDKELSVLLQKLKKDDICLITADHGCDPSTPSTDHSREYVPLLVYGADIKEGTNLRTRKTFADIGKTVAEIFGEKENALDGESFWEEIKKQR